MEGREEGANLESFRKFIRVADAQNISTVQLYAVEIILAINLARIFTCTCKPCAIANGLKYLYGLSNRES